MTGRADFHADVALVGRPGLEGVSASADHINFGISRMNASLHGKGILSRIFSIAKQNPRDPDRTTGVGSLELPEA
jgi:hypothetical protein